MLLARTGLCSIFGVLVRNAGSGLVPGIHGAGRIPALMEKNFRAISKLVSAWFRTGHRHRVMRVLFGIGLLVVSVLSLMPIDHIPESLGFWDKLEHFLADAALTICGALAYSEVWQLRLVGAGLVCTAVCLNWLRD